MKLRQILPRAGFAALLLVGFACKRSETAAGSTSASAGGGDNPVVATLDGKNIDAAALEAWIKDDLYKREVGDKAPGEVYDLRVQAIDSMVDERLMADAAAKANMSPDLYLQDQVKALGAVNDDEIKAFFEQNRSRLPPDATLEAYAARIKSHLEAQRPDKVRENLRSKAQLVMLMQPPRANVEATGPSRGPADAIVTMVEFSDYQCPFCKRAEPVVNQLMQKYPTQLRLVYRNMPLDALHPRARAAAIAAVCADAQGKFWEYHDKLFGNQQALADSDLEKYAADVGIDAGQFKTCRADPATEARVNNDAEAARAAGLNGTPAFFVNGILVSGARPLEDFTRWIDKEIAAKSGTPEPKS
jgi:protein-disulfide isomerase